MTRTEALKTIREFLAIPPQAMTQAAWRDEEDEFWGCPWAALRAIARSPRGQRAVELAGCRLLLRADRPDWREGIEVIL